MILDSHLRMTYVWWDLTSASALVLSLVRASCLIWACASGNLGSHAGADMLKPMSAKT